MNYYHDDSDPVSDVFFLICIAAAIFALFFWAYQAIMARFFPVARVNGGVVIAQQGERCRAPTMGEIRVRWDVENASLVFWDWGDEDGDEVMVDVPGWEDRPFKVGKEKIAVPLPKEMQEVRIRCVSEGMLPGCTVAVTTNPALSNADDITAALKLRTGQVGLVRLKR